MAHNLFITGGQAAMFSVREVPWHGLGQVLDHVATSAEAIKAARLDWRVKKVPLWACEGPIVAQVPQRCAIVPEDRWGKPDCPVLGVVGRDYTPLQNTEAFSFFDSIVGMKAAIYHTAGALDDGRRVWVLAKLPGEIRVVGDDVTHKFLLLANGHDGNTAVQMKFTPVRVVCQNTLSLALSTGRAQSVHHGAGFWRRMADAKQALGIIQHGFAAIELKYQAMASIPLCVERLHEYLAAVFPEPRPDASDWYKAQVQQERSECIRLFEDGTGNDLPKVKGTLWAAFNAITEYVDHYRGDQSPPSRLRSIWFGQGLQIKTRAYEVACRIAATPRP